MAEDEKERKPDDPEQSQRFVETAKDLESDETGDIFKKAIRKDILNRTSPANKSKGDEVT